MADIRFTATDQAINRAAAMHRDTQADLKMRQEIGAEKAAAILKEHFYEGHSFIDTSSSAPDHYVILDDTRGLLAAMSIEFGRAKNEAERMKPVEARIRTTAVNALRGAFGLKGV